MEYQTIEVTQEHLDAGQPKSAGNCPVALALLAICCNPHVYPKGQMELRYKGNYKHPRSEVVSRFTARFDVGLPVEPFTFRIRV